MQNISLSSSVALDDDDDESTAHYLRSYRYNANEVQQEDVRPFTLSIEGYVRVSARKLETPNPLTRLLV